LSGKGASRGAHQQTRLPQRRVIAHTEMVRNRRRIFAALAHQAD